MAENQDEIKHYGVKGMHWGVRRRSSSSVSTAPRRKEIHSDRKQVNDLKRNSNKTLSNAELETIRRRLQLEQNVNKLKGQDTTINRGHEAAKAALAIGTTAASLYALSQTPAGKAAIATGKKLFVKTG